MANVTDVNGGKVHLVIDRESQSIIAQELIENTTSDESQIKPLFDSIDAEINPISADGAYDSSNVYKAVEEKSSNAVVSIPPAKTAVITDTTAAARKHNIEFIDEYGRQRWQDYSDYNYRSLVETAMFRYKKLICDRMFSRTLSVQKIESRFACHVLNKMASLGTPASVKIKSAA